MNRIPSLLLVFLLFSLPVSQLRSQYLHREGKYILDGSGKRIILRGMGLGGWMLQEGYMLETAAFAGPQHEIRATIEALVGVRNTSLFYRSWLANHCTRDDIDSLASWGFNSVRLPMHYNLFTLPVRKEPVRGRDTWLDTGFRMVDSLLDWCAGNGMYLILDLHAAPGGQGKDANISDYDPGLPSLWECPENQRKTVSFWRKLAERYANEPWIGGYDLLNEPNWAFTGGHPNGCDDTENREIWDLYRRITDTIRAVDSNHLIFIEGNCWATNFSGLEPLWDDNLALSFHRYWNPTDLNSISKYTDLRDTWNVPLWMGESGENSNQWFCETIKLLEENQIGWSWWPLKKINSIVGPLTVVKTPEYQQILDYWKGNSPRPSEQFAFRALMQITENLRISDCIFHPDVIDAMFRQQKENTAIPIQANPIPGRIFAVDYDLGQAGVAYLDKEDKNTGEPGSSSWNLGRSYRNDGVDIEKSTDVQNPSGFYVGWTEDGEWLHYTLNVKETGIYRLKIRAASETSVCKVSVEINGLPVIGSVSLPSTGGSGTWEDLLIGDLRMTRGRNHMKFRIEKGGFSIGYFDFSIMD